MLEQFIGYNEAEDVPGTYFVLRSSHRDYLDSVDAAGWAEAVRRMEAVGEVGIHGLTHNWYTDLTPEQTGEDLRAMEGYITSALGGEWPEPHYSRYTYGAYSDDTEEVVNTELGYSHVPWDIEPVLRPGDLPYTFPSTGRTIDQEDLEPYGGVWYPLETDANVVPNELADLVEQRVQDFWEATQTPPILLLHPIHETTVSAWPVIVSRLRQQDSRIISLGMYDTYREANAQ